jgi:hypothetical protein
VNRFAALTTLAACAALSACQTPSADLQAYRATEGDQLAFAEALPLERRLDLHHALYSERRHPRDSSLSTAFNGSGQAGYDAALNRIVSRDTFFSYIWVLKAVDRGGPLDLCEPRYMQPIQRRAKDAGLLPQDLTGITFRRCALVEGWAG